MRSNQDISILINEAKEKANYFFDNIYGNDLESKLYEVYIKLCQDKGLTSFRVGSSKSSLSLGTAFYQRVNHSLNRDGESIEYLDIDYIDFIQCVFSEYTWPSIYEEIDGTKRLGYGECDVNKENIKFQAVYSRDFIDVSDEDIWAIIYAYFILNNGYDLENMSEEDKRKAIGHLTLFNSIDIKNILKEYYDGQIIRKTDA